jgi:hypothetical protein
LLDISAPLLFLNESSKMLKKKKKRSNNFLWEQASKVRMGNVNPKQLLAQAGITHKYSNNKQEEVNESHTFELANDGAVNVMVRRAA